MQRILATTLALVLFCTAALAQTAPRHEVPGLKLPAPQDVKFDEGFVTVTADCKGTVKWLVLSTHTKIKFKISTGNPNEIIVAIPPEEGEITLFAIGLVDGKQTDFARTDLRVGGTKPNPPPPATIKFPLHLTIVEDPAKRTEAIRSIIDSPELAQRLAQKRVVRRVFSIQDPFAKTPKVAAELSKHGAPLLILQDHDGQGLLIQRLPNSQAELLKLVSPFVGGF